MKRFFTLNAVFAIYLVMFVVIIGGFAPRWTALVAVMLLAVWMLLRPLEDGVLFFIRTVPLFIALPLTSSYDNLNMWRPLSLVLFFRFLAEPSTRAALIHIIHDAFSRPASWLKAHPVARRLGILLLFAGLSLIGAKYPAVGIKRIIYFVNLSFVPTLVWALLRQGRLTSERVIRNLAIPTMVVVVAGFLQLASTYLLDVYQFMRLWGEQIQLRQFGAQWSYIAVNVGNTWLAYYGDQLSLRVFSLFPDSHSFPTFVLLGLPALLAMTTGPILRIAESLPLKRLVHTYASMSIVWVPAAFLAAILSGTRGIWAASLGVLTLVPILMWLMRRLHVDTVRRRVFAYGASYLAVFFLLFAVAWPVFISPQFLVGKGDLGMFARRIRSVIDFGETSNALRLAIWKSSVISIAHHPLLGVGIGNFPVVLQQDIQLARAGSTAHNLYLHVAAEMGVIAAIEVIALLLGVLSSAWRWFASARGPSLVYAAALLLYLPWVYAYVLTDPIIFDERVYLMFATTLALVWANDHD